MIKEYTREELINICERAVVPFYKWENRDSHSAQTSIDSIYRGLTANLNYNYKIKGRIIWVEFIREDDMLDKIRKDGRYLNIDGVVEYRNAYPDYEMFEGYGIDFINDEYLGSYMPTEERLQEVNGDDWY